MRERPDNADIDWSKITFEGAERENLRAWRRLSFDDKLKAAEEMNDFANEMLARRKARGLPYIDPDTGEFVRGRSSESGANHVADGAVEYPGES